MIVPVILCGGSGTRLWPLSTNTLPKQFISINSSGSTLLEDTINRLSCFDCDPFLVLSRNHPLPNSLLASYGNRIIYEDNSNDTAVAVLRAVLQIKRVLYGEEIILLVVPSDHYIGNQEYFVNDMKRGIEKVDDDNIVLFGIQPNGPETKYGYIIPNREKIIFKEKPSIDKAIEFLHQGAMWNSGIFAANIDTIITAMSRSSYNIYDWIYNPREGKAPSFDVAILQEYNNIYAYKCSNWNWSDVGTWDAFMRIPEIIQERELDLDTGKTIIADVPSSNNVKILNRSNGTVVVIGCDDITIINTGNNTLVMSNKSNTDILKNIATLLNG